MTDGTATQDTAPLHESSAGERTSEETVWQNSEWLRLELTAATLYFIERERAVWFPRLGIFFPTTTTIPTTKVMGSRLVVQQETTRTVQFEKCSELVAFQRERFPLIVELPELADRIHEKLPGKIRQQVSPKTLRAEVQRIINIVRMDVIRRGCSRLLPGLGTLYALHNRQGEVEADWFAGADIVLVDGYRRTLRANAPLFLDRPILRDAFELFEAAYGPRVSESGCTFGVVTDREQLDQSGKPKITVATFRRSTADRAGKVPLLVVTDGLRKFSSQRAELVFEVEYDAGVDWALSLIRTLSKADDGAVIASLSRGTILELPKVLRPTAPPHSRRDAVGVESLAIVPYPRTPETHRTASESFNYHLCLGITQDESQFAEQTNLATLLFILERRGFYPTTKLVRSSVLNKSSLIPGTPHSNAAQVTHG